VPGSAAPASGETAGWGLEQRYDLLGKIGEGTYGVVHLATSKQDKKRVYAIKKFKTGRVRSSSSSSSSGKGHRGILKASVCLHFELQMQA
jgi:serine/threonine protein kinase